VLLGGYKAFELREDEDHRVIIFTKAIGCGASKLLIGSDLEDAGFFSREQIHAGEPDLTEFTKMVLLEEGWL
jgi:hypothetical protein